MPNFMKMGLKLSEQCGIGIKLSNVREGDCQSCGFDISDCVDNTEKLCRARFRRYMINPMNYLV